MSSATPSQRAIGNIMRFDVILEDPYCDLPALVRDECGDLVKQIAEQTIRIYAKTKTVKEMATTAGTARWSQTMLGVGPLTALAVVAFAPAMQSFKRGRVSKPSRTHIRRLLTIGAMSRLNWMGRKTISEGSRLARMLARKPRMLVASKMVRGIWAILTKNQDYRDPVPVVAAR